MFRTFFDRSKRQVPDIIRARFDSVRYNQGKFMTENVSRKKPPVNNGSIINVYHLQSKGEMFAKELCIAITSLLITYLRHIVGWLVSLHSTNQLVLDF